MNISAEIVTVISSSLIGLAVGLAGTWFVPVWDAITNRYTKDMSRRMLALGIDKSQLNTKLKTYLRLWGAAMAAVAVIFGVILLMPPVAIALIYLIYIAPRIILGIAIERRSSLIRDQMVAASVALANATRSGLSLVRGIDNVSQNVPEPLSREMREIYQKWRGGRDLYRVLDETKSRLQLDSFTLFASAIAACDKSGGDVSQALENISHSLQENQRIERKLEAETASGRKALAFLAIFPIPFLLFYCLIFWEGAGLLFTTLFGQFVLVGVIAVVFASIRWSRRILDIQI